jgi:RNA polymerase sigma factor (sigma-70 family)
MYMASKSDLLEMQSVIEKTVAHFSHGLTPEEIKDLVQDVNVIMLSRGLEGFSPDGGTKLSTWTYMIAKRVVIDRFNHYYKHRHNDLGDIEFRVTDERDDVLPAIIRREQEQLLAQAVKSLRPKDRELYHALYEQGLTASEYAKRHHIPAYVACLCRKRLIARLANKVKYLKLAPARAAAEQISSAEQISPPSPPAQLASLAEPSPVADELKTYIDAVKEQIEKSGGWNKKHW